MSRYTTSDVRNFSIFEIREWLNLETECRYLNRVITWSINGEEISRIGYSVSTELDNPYIELNYRTQNWGETEWKSIKYRIPLEIVPCNYGGVRWYFKCPMYSNRRYCGRRVAIMYKASEYFSCRRCANLTYESCNESKRFRDGIYRILSNAWKADELYMGLKRTYYNGKPTKKYRRCLKLLGSD